MAKRKKIHNIIDELMQAIKRDERSSDISHLDQIMAEKTSRAGYDGLADRISRKSSQISRKPKKESSGPRLLNIFGLSLVTTVISAVLVLGGAYLLGYLDFLKETPTIGTLTELADTTPTPVMTLKPTTFTDSGYAAQQNTFKMNLESPLTSQAKKAIRVEPEIDFDVIEKTSQSSQTIEIVPKDDLEENTTYTITLEKGTQFENGSTLKKDLAWSFKTEPDFAIIDTTPRDNSEEVPVNSTIEFEFNHKNIDVQGLSDYVEINPSVRGKFEKHGMKIVFVPEEELKTFTAYSVTIDKGYSNEAGEQLERDYHFSFTTGDRKINGEQVYHRTVNFTSFFQVLNNTDRISEEVCSYAGQGDDVDQLTYELYKIDLQTAIDTLLSNSGKVEELPDNAKLIDTHVPITTDPCTEYTHEPGKGIYILKVSSKYTEYPVYVMRTISDIGLLANVEREATKGWAFDMNSEAGISGVGVTGYTYDGGKSSPGSTGESGFYEIPGADFSADFVLAQKGNDYAFAGKNFGFYDPELAYWSSYGFSGSGYSSYIYTDKPAYQAGDIVNFKVISKSWLGKSTEDLNGKTIKISAGYMNGWHTSMEGSVRKAPVFEKEYTANDYGTFSGRFVIPASHGSSDLILEASIDNLRVGTEQIIIEEFSKPEEKYEVSISKDKYFAGESVNVNISGEDYSGLPLSGETVTVELTRGKFSKEGIMQSWNSGFESNAQEIVETKDIQLGSEGIANYNFVPILDGTDSNFYIYAVKVLDKNKLSASYGASEKIFVSDADTNIVVKTDKSAYDYVVGESAEITFEAEKLWSGEIAAGHEFQVDVIRNWSETVPSGSYYSEVTKSFETSYETVRHSEKAVDNRSLRTDKNGRITLQLNNLLEGNYSVRVKFDGTQKLVEGIIYTRMQERIGRSVEVTVQSEDVKPGDKVDVEIFTTADAAGIVQVYGEKLYNWSDFSKKGGDTPYVYSFTATESMYPQVSVCANVIQSEGKDGSYGAEIFKSGKAFVSACTTINIDSETSVINLDISSDKEIYKPGEEVTLDVNATNYKGVPVKTELSFDVVDQSLRDLFRVQDLTNDEISRYFHSRRSNGVSTYMSGSAYWELAGGMGALGGGEVIRDKFKDVALWMPEVETDFRGKAQVKFQLPDNLTTWNLGVIATDEDTKFGAGHIRFVSKLDQNVSIDNPKFIRQGDRLVGQLEIANYGEKDFAGKIELELADSDQVWEKNVEVKKYSRMTLNPEIEVSSSAEELTINVLLSASTGDIYRPVDGIKKNIDVYSSSLTTHKVQTGIIKDGLESIQVPVDLGTDFNPKLNKIDLTVSRMFSIQELFKDEPIYSDSTISLSSVMLHNSFVYSNFDLIEPDVEIEVLEKRVANAYSLLLENQADNGGFAWFGHDAVSVESSVTAAEALGAVDTSGLIAVNDVAKEDLSDYLESVLYSEKFSNYDKVSAFYGLSWIDQEKAQVHIPQFINLAEQSVEIQRSPLTLAYLMQAFNNLDFSGNNVALARYLEKTANTNDRGSYWIDAESNYKVAESSDYVTAMVYQAISPIEEWGLKEKTRNWMIDRSSTDFASDERYLRIVYALGVSEVENLYSRDISGNFEILVNGKRAEVVRLSNDDNRVKASIDSGYLKKGENLIEVTRSNQGDAYIILDSVILEESDNRSNSDDFSINKELFDLDSGQEISPEDVRRGDLVKVRLSVTPKHDFDNVLIYDQLPAGVEVANFSYYDTSLHVWKKFYEDNPEGYWINRFPDLVNDRVSFSESSMDAGEVYYYEYVVSAVYSGDFSSGSTYVGVELFPDVSSVRPGEVWKID
ncbi:hypothetical protein GF357_01420 [Candidatus Dojkabacteria bacterium]|nr:hypothetical protein [Candidatus Dojkabacteria bacterium]